MGHIIKSDRARKYIYGVVSAAIPVAVVLGFITEEQAVTVGGAILGLASAVLALPNTPSKSDKIKRQGYEQDMA